MARELIYVDLGEGKKAIQADENGLPMFKEDVSNADGSVASRERSADVFHLLDRIPAMGADLDKNKKKVASLEGIANQLVEKGILTSDDLASGNKEYFSKWLSEAIANADKVKNYDASKTKDLDEITRQLQQSNQERINSIESAYKTKLSEYENEIKTADESIRKMMINDRFSSSDFIKKNCDGIPYDVIASNFAHRFKIEKDEFGNRITVGYSIDGKPLYSDTRPTDFANFEEAIAKMIRADKNAGYYLTGIAAGGSGGNAGRSSMNSLQNDYEKALKAGDTVLAGAIMRKIKEQK